MKQAILARRLGAEPQTQTLIVRYRVMRDPTASGAMLYLVGGVGFGSMKQLKAAYPGAEQFERIKATRKGRIYG